MMTLCCELLEALKGKTLATAESCTGGMIGSAITAVPGSSAVYCGGIISYTNAVKHNILGVPEDMLNIHGAVSAAVAEAMAAGARKVMCADIAVSVTGLAGPDADDSGKPVGTVYIGYADDSCLISRHFVFEGDRESVRLQAVKAALSLIVQIQNNGGMRNGN